MIKPQYIQKQLFILLLAAILSLQVNGQIIAYYNIGAFNTPSNQPYLETYLTIVGNSLSSKLIDGKHQNSVNIEVKILKDSTIVKANKYNLIGPTFSDTLNPPAFIDNQRYSLPNGIYTLHMTLTDKNQPSSKPTQIKQAIVISFNQTQIQSSSIQALEYYKKTTIPTSISKSGYDLIPYNINYYPESTKELNFYFETYNTDTVLGINKPFLYVYYLENSDNLFKLNSYGDFRKQKTAKVNPLLAKINISNLGSGNYNLVIEAKDENNITHIQKKYFFQRLNKSVDIVALSKYSEKKTVSEYFGSCNNIDTLKMFVECLWPIANGLDKERIINQAVKKDPELMKNFVVDFWQRRAADTGNALKMWADYYKSVQEVMVLFKCGKQQGYYSERGRVYLQYGKPSQRSMQYAEENTFPYEIWQYYTLNDKATNHNFSNRKFVFVNKNIGDDCHVLVHSDMRGELYNDRWRFEVTRRNNNGIGNPDNVNPAGIQDNQFNEIYNNPR
ncbi:MAG: GWxTD domain-containing protein [Bacteroidota bacterium]|nr:GWxTD domain-containing protein [Bacteroidota bacterium]MDP3145553.1 GWxTD domain-containing protein [Bacteroidota bacterium]MDP3557979.1 GWxTD domain-containing protein [Bacteroidota bacterium]